MKSLFRMLMLGVFILSLTSFVTPIEHPIDCSSLHEGTFLYGNSKDRIEVIIKGNHHTEYHNNGKYFSQSKLDWIDDCSFNMTMEEVTIPDFPFGKGDVMNLQVDAVEGNKISYTASVKGYRWNGTLIKVE